jgi:hypothetical protein
MPIQAPSTSLCCAICQVTSAIGTNTTIATASVNRKALAPDGPPETWPVALA